MKNGLLVWNIVLTIAAGYLFFVHFSSKKKKDTAVKGATTDNKLFRVNSPFRIAYFEMDSIENNSQVVKDAKAEITRKEDAINAELNKLARELQQRYEYFRVQKAQGNLNDEQEQAAAQELKSRDENMQNRKKALDQEYNEFVARKMNTIKSSIEDFLKEYNRDKNYSYIIAYEQGLFYYKDSAYNITPDVIRGLNELYRNKKN